MEYFRGIDIGASTAKLVVIDRDRRVAGRAIRASGVNYTETADILWREVAEAAGIGPSDVRRTISTGYGRDNVPWADGKMTELACHGKGAYDHFRRAITVIDIGAQDNKVIQLNAAGRRTGFKMNRKCAAGTGSFLEEIAHRLDLPVADLNDLAERSTKDLTLGSFCTVFAATEILGKIRAGEQVEDIVKGAFRSVAQRVFEMDTVDGTLVMTGGVVAHNRLLTEMVGRAFSTEALMPPAPQYVGALGAALFALETEGDV